jgi:uncharacterized membrane protein YccC
MHTLMRRQWPHVLHAARGTVAAMAALTAAVALNLECPYWAAMTALIVIQPTRGLLLEKSVYRLVGTAIGSGAGMLMLISSRSPAMLTILLAVWLAACVGIGNLLYGLRSYGALVAACTGAVIAMAGYNSPPHLHDLVFGRIACITIGIVVSTTVTLFFTTRRSKRELLDRLAKVAVADIEWVALLVREDKKEDLVALRQDVLVEIAEIEGAIDATWAGSLDLKQRKRRVRSLIVSLLSLLEVGKLAGDHLGRCGSGLVSWREPLARHLEQVARQIDEQGTIDPAQATLTEVLAEADAHLPLLGETLGELVTSLQRAYTEWDEMAPDSERPTPNQFIRHRDWQEAGRAALRAAFAIIAVGAVWHFTDRIEGTLMLTAASIMVSIFSTHDRPAVMLTHVFCGATLGVAAAFVCRLVLLPGTGNPLLQGAISVPVLMAGLIALSHRRTALGAMDFTLFFLFVMQPGVPTVPAPASYVAGGVAALGGIGIAILSFRFLLPIDPARRLRSILTAIVHDLSTMIAEDSLKVVKKCRARTHHRVLRVIANATKLDEKFSGVVEGALAALAIGRCMQRLRETGQHAEMPQAAANAVRKARLRLSAAVQRPEEILSALEDASIALSEATYVDIHTVPMRKAIPDAGEAQLFQSEMLLVGGHESQCRI